MAKRKTAKSPLKRQFQKTKKEEYKYDPANQVEGLKERFEGAGLDSEQVADERNLFKKTLNLKEDQNILFDFFEILGRPQQAMFGAINSMQQDGELGEGLLEGIKGNKETKFKDILHESGMEESDVIFGFDDALGMAGDIFLDPMKWAFLPAGAAGAAGDISKAAKEVSKAQELLNTSKETLIETNKVVDGLAKTLSTSEEAYENAKKVVDLANKLRDDKTLDVITEAKTMFGDDYAKIISDLEVDGHLLQDLERINKAGKLEHVKSVSEKHRKALSADRSELIKAQDRQHYEMSKVTSGTSTLSSAERKLKMVEKMGDRRVSASQFVAHKMGTGIKGTFRMADSGLVKLFDWLDANNIKKLEKLGITGVGMKGRNAFGDAMGTYGKMYETLKNTVTNTFNHMSKFPKEMMSEISKIKGGMAYAKDNALNVLKNRGDEFNKIVEKISKDTQIPPEDVSKLLTGMYENGSKIFTEDIDIVSKKYNLKVTLSGMNKEVTLNEIIFADRFLQDMSLTKENAEMFEDFVKTFLPDFYEKEVSKAIVKDGHKGLFRVTDTGKGVVGEQYRIRDIELHEKLREAWEGLSDESLRTVSEVDREKMFRALALSDDKKYEQLSKQFRDMKVKEESLTGIKNNITHYEGLAASGKRKAVPRDAAKAAGYFEKQKSIDIIDKRIKRIDSALNKPINDAYRQRLVKERVAKQAERTELFNWIKDYNRENNKWIRDILLEENEKFNEITKEVNTYKRTMNFSGKLVDGEFKIDGKNVKDMASKKFNIGNHYTDVQIENMKKLYTEHTDDVKDALGSIQLMHTEVGNLITTYIGEGLSVDDYYISHSITPEWEQAKAKSTYYSKVTNYNDKAAEALAGNTTAFQARRYQTSIVEANHLAEGKLEWLRASGAIKEEEYLRLKQGFDEGMKMFSEDLHTSFVDFINKGTRTAADAHIYSAVVKATIIPTKGELGAMGFKKDNLVRMTKPGEYKSMAGFNNYNSKAFVQKMQGLAPYLPESERAQLIGAIKEAVKDGGEIWINKDIDRLIGRVVFKESDKKHLLEVFDTFNRMFKKNKLLSPGFQLRNLMGSVSNMWLGGMPMSAAVGNMNESRKFIENGKEILDKYHKGIKLTQAEKDLMKDFSEFASLGFANMGNRIHDVPEELLYPNKVKADNAYELYKKQKGAAAKAADEAGEILQFRNPNSREIAAIPKNAYDSLISMNLNKNLQYDAMNRYTVWKYAKDNPDWMFSNGYDSPEDAVRKILFDYTDLSENEQEVMKRIMPFYTFTKKNIAFQTQNIMKNTNRYITLKNMNESMWKSLTTDEDELNRYQYENFWIPIPVAKDGKYTAIKASLPIGNFGEFMNTPIKRSISSMTPPLRAPFEIASNTQMFSGMPISNYKGEKGYYIPEMTKKMEYGLSQFGLDVPAMGGMDPVRAFRNLGTEDGADNFLDFGVQAFGRSVASQGDFEINKERKAYNKMDHLQNQLRAYRQKGIDIPTLAEINNRKKFASSTRILGQLRQFRK